MRTDFNPPDLSSCTELVYDVETDGLDWKRNHAVGHVLTWGPNPDETVYWPIRHAEGENYDPEQVHKYLRKLFANKSLRVIGHHFKFDMHMAKNEGITFHGPVECTQVNQALIDENQGKYSLDFCAKSLGVQAKKGDALYVYLAEKFGGEPNYKQMEHFHKLSADDPMAIEYAEGDGTTTWQLREAQHKYIAEDKLEQVHDIECRVTKTLFRMERVGVPINQYNMDQMTGEIASTLEAYNAELPFEVADARKKKVLKELLIDQGHTDWPMTAPSKTFPDGQPSFKEEWLKTFDLGKKIIRVRKYTNLMNSFITPLKERHIFEGRVYTTFNQMKMDDFGTVTGRLSSSGPNMQQVPKRDKELAPMFRSIFAAPDGTFWSANDYSQQEFRLFANYTGSPVLVAGYNAEPYIDAHTNVAELLDVERDPTAKRMNLGMVYGMGVLALAGHLGITKQQASIYRNKYHKMIPESKSYLKETEYWARQRGYVRSKLGRRRRFPDSRHAYKAGNNIIQMTAADMTKVKMVEIDEYFASKGDDCKIALQVHDELDWFVPFGCEDQDLEAKRIMKSFGPDDEFELKVPTVVDGSRGENWEGASFGTNWLDGK
jgi:DNA polymerase-1